MGGWEVFLGDSSRLALCEKYSGISNHLVLLNCGDIIIRSHSENVLTYFRELAMLY